MTKTATVSLHGNTYEVDAGAGRAQGRTGVRPVRPDNDRGAPRRHDRWAWRSRTGSAAIPTPRPDPRSPKPPPQRPGSTTCTWSPTPTRPNSVDDRLRRPGRPPHRQPRRRPAPAMTPSRDSVPTHDSIANWPPSLPCTHNWPATGTTTPTRTSHYPGSSTITPLDDVADHDGKETPVSIERLQAHWGFTQIPFGRDLAPATLHRHNAHAEAVARIGWCIDQHALGVVTGEVGAGKTVAVRAAIAALDPSRHVTIYLPNPSVGVRGIHHHVVSALWTGTELPPRHPRPAGRRRAGRRTRRTRPDPGPDLRRGAPARQRPTRGRPDAHQPRHGLRRPVRRAARRTSRPYATGYASASSPPSTNGSPSATRCPA